MTVRAVITAQMRALTTGERKIASVLLADYPSAGLVPIQQLACHARVRAPSVTRFVGKLGCGSFQDFQRRLELLGRRQATGVLVGDVWLSPIAAHASHAFALPVDPGTVWDTHVSLVTLIESRVVRVAEAGWSATCRRPAAWDRLRFAPEEPTSEHRTRQG